MPSIVPRYTRLFRQGRTLTPPTELVAVEGSPVLVAHAFTGAQRRLDGVDTVVLSMGRRSTNAISRALRNRGAARHAIGDGVAPRGIHQAILEGTRVARAI